MITVIVRHFFASARSHHFTGILKLPNLHIYANKTKESITSQKLGSGTSNGDVCSLCNRPVKIRVECGICSRWFYYKCERTTEERLLKEYPHETYYICKKNKEQKQLAVAIRDLRKQQQEEEDKKKKKIEIEVKYKNLQKIHECTKKENKTYEAEILKLRH